MPQKNDKLTIVLADKAFPCAYEGQEAAVQRIDPQGDIETVLRCGHPYIAAPQVFGLEPADVAPAAEEPEPEPESAPEENKTMSKKAQVIPDSRGVIHVPGHGEIVESFRDELAFFNRLDKRVAASKRHFRDLAAAAVSGATGDVRRVEFLSDKGVVVPVSLPDTDKPGNRSNLNDDDRSAIAKLGANLDEMGVTEETHTYVLSGAFVAWMDQVLQEKFVSQGLPIPDEVQKKTVTKLTTEGIAKLKELAQNAPTVGEKAVAEYLIQNGLSAASVTAK